MRHILLVISLTFITTPVYSVDWRDTCEKLAGAAESIMMRRQEGLSMAKIMNIAEGNAIMETLIIAAI